VILVPRTAVTAVLELYHGNVSIHNHNGRNKTISQIRKRFTWPSLYADVDKWIKACGQCVERKRVVLTQARYTLSTNVESASQRLCIDFVGPLTTTKKKNSYLLTMVNPFTRWAEAFPVTRNTALKTIACLKKHISDHGTPAELLTDRGFLSEELRVFLRSMGIRHNCTAAYTPSTNGSCEGFHSYLATSLSALVNEQHSDWDDKIPDALLAYRTADLDGMGISPFEATYGRPANLPLDNVLRDPDDWFVDEPVAPDEEAERLHEYAAGVAEASIRNRAVIQSGQQDRHERNKRQDDGSRSAPQYQKGQQVYLRFPKGNFRVGRGCTKFTKVNSGPYTIETVMTTTSGATIYEVRHNLTSHFCKVGCGRMIPYEKWVEPAGTSRPSTLPGHIRPAERKAKGAAAAPQPRTESSSGQKPDEALREAVDDVEMAEAAAGQPAATIIIDPAPKLPQPAAPAIAAAADEREERKLGEALQLPERLDDAQRPNTGRDQKRKLEEVLHPAELNADAQRPKTGRDRQNEPPTEEAPRPAAKPKPAAPKPPSDYDRPVYVTTAAGRRGRQRLNLNYQRIWEPFAHPGSR
jgi:transposase InsO family protein